MSRVASVAFAAAFLALWLAPVFSQTTSAEITGTVVDAQSSIVPGAKVTITLQATGESRSATTDNTGNFAFLALVPGTYQLRVEATGFKSVQQNGIVLTASEKRSVGSIALSVGSLSESVTVAADAVQVQTASAENSALISTQQVNDLMARGRDVITFMRVLPGVTGASDNDAAGGSFGTATPTVSGVRNSLNNVTLDGQNSTNTDVTNTFSSLVSLDDVQEVKVLTNGYQAEYGRNAGGSINIISKSGTRDFHGGAYYYGRNEDLNANNFFSNRQGLSRPLYRYNTFGGTIGGPVYVPHKFNSNRDKLFFFYNLEKWNITTPGSTFQTMVPTAAERSGDFSQSSVKPIDPITGQPFPNNQIPAAGTPGCGVQLSCLNPTGQAILNLLPAANFFNTAISKGTYDYLFQDIQADPKTQQSLKLDYNPTGKDKVSLRVRRSLMDQRGNNGIFGGPFANVQRFYGHYGYDEQGGLITYTRIISPAMVNELSFGDRGTREHSEAASSTAWDPLTRSKVGLGGLGQWYPQNNPYNIIPNLSFSLPGGQVGPSFALDCCSLGRFPIAGGDYDYTILDNLSYTRGVHQLKFGFFYERDSSTRGPRGLTKGAFSWSNDTSDPSGTGNPFADAVVGHFRSYTEATNMASSKNLRSLYEWFAQDSWKASRRLTVELGLRMGAATPLVFIHGDAAAFIPGLYNPANAPVYIVPRCQNDTLTTDPHACTTTNPRRGMNPLTGQIVPATLIGSYVPNTGNVINGMVTGKTPGYTDGFISGTGLQLSPRFGFAWDVFGDGKTSIRGNAAIMKNMLQSNGAIVNGANPNPPNEFTPQLLYGNLSTYLSTAGVLFPPSSITGWDPNYKTPSVYEYSLAIQREVVRNTILDVAYVGNQSRHLMQSVDLNVLPYGTRFLSSSVDPTTGGVLPDNLLRPLPGWGSAVYSFYGGTSNYNALQTQVNRRFAHRAQFGLAYTWSKSLDYTDGDNGAYPRYLNPRTWLYGVAGYDQPHVFTANYSYEFPKLSTLWNNGFVREAFDGWQVSGITTFAMGTPLSMSFSTTPSVDLVGGGDGQRVDVTGPVALSAGDRSFTRWFAVESVIMPGKGDIGNAGKAPIRGPGTNNWDMALAKTFPLRSEKRNLQFRWEAYNVFNHTQWSGVNTTASFNSNTGQQTNALFGQVTAARAPRIMQGSLRFQF